MTQKQRKRERRGGRGREREERRVAYSPYFALTWDNRDKHMASAPNSDFKTGLSSRVGRSWVKLETHLRSVVLTKCTGLIPLLDGVVINL